MAAPEWIQLYINPDTDPKILRLVELTGQSTEHVFACVIRWFWHVDRHYSTPRAGIQPTSVNRICRWLVDAPKGCVDLATAMQDTHVAWLRLAGDGTVIIPEFEKHFGRNSKRRALDARRKRRERKEPGVPETSAKRPHRCGRNVDLHDTTRDDPTRQKEERNNRSGPVDCRDGSGNTPEELFTGPDRPGYPRDDTAWRSMFALRIVTAAGLDPVRSKAQIRPLNAIATRLIGRKDRDECARKLELLAAEKRAAGMQNPMAAWQATVNELYPKEEGCG